MLEGMAVRRHTQYDAHTQKMTGFVASGGSLDETSVASEALVFMVEGLQGHWKMPIACFLIKSLTPDTQMVLLQHALEALHKRGIKVVCVTMDGHLSNISVCTMPGCQLKLNPLEPLRTYFTHPSSGEKVFVMMDPCHTLKLTRNMLQAYGSINSPVGAVKWSYLSDLNVVQEKEGLHAANRITSRNINFTNQKMKVQGLNFSGTMLDFRHRAVLNEYNT